MHGPESRQRAATGARAAAVVLRGDDSLAQRSAPAMADVPRMLTEQAERHAALRAELGTQEELQAQLEEITADNAAVREHADARVRGAREEADRRIAAARHTAGRRVDAAEQRGETAVALAEAAARETERAKQARIAAENAHREVTEQLTAAELELDRLRTALRVAETDLDRARHDLDAERVRAAAAEQRATSAEDALTAATARAETRAEPAEERADAALKRAEQDARRADEATARADRATARADRERAEADRLRGGRACLHRDRDHRRRAPAPDRRE
jgi:chromosome segregation ATPase